MSLALNKDGCPAVTAAVAASQHRSHESNDNSSQDDISFGCPSGSKATKAFLQNSRRKEFWNEKKDKQAHEMTWATYHAAEVLKFAATQNSINARVGHLILLGQKRQAMNLLQQTQDMIEVPQDALVAGNSDNNSDDDEDDDECPSK